MSVHILDVCLASLALYLVRRLLWGRAEAPLPPGPPGWPLLGNLFDFPAYAPYKTFQTMGRKYGPIISLKMLGTQYVVLNSLEANRDLLVKRSFITSNKPHFTMAGDLVGWGNSMILLQYGDTFRKQRKFFRGQIGAKSMLEAYYPVEEEEAKRFLRSVLTSNGDQVAHSRRMAASVILKISHGYSVKEDQDPLVKMADTAMENFSAIVAPGRFIVDVIPVLRFLPDWFPGAGFHTNAKRWRKMVTETADTPHTFVLEHLAKGDAAPSFTSRLLQEGITSEEEEILKWTSFSMYLGGSDTTPASVNAFFLAMTLYPDILRKAQAEVDAVVGHERLPTFEDRHALPYVNAICTELLRWHVVGPLAMRVSTEDIFYEGYYISKGTCFLGNIWSILTDPETYPNPDVFDPDRFLGESPQLDPREACFGWGRRSCPGVHVVELTLYICVVMAVATLDVSCCVENGIKHVPRYDTKEGLVRHVRPFKCRVTPRSKKAEQLLQV